MPKQEINETLKELMRQAIDERGGQIPFDEAKEIIRPHFAYDIETLAERALANKTRYVISSLRDRQGVRDVFGDDESMFTDIQKIHEIAALERIEVQLRRKIDGLRKALDKVTGKKKELEGQIDMFEKGSEE